MLPPLSHLFIFENTNNAKNLSQKLPLMKNQLSLVDLKRLRRVGLHWTSEPPPPAAHPKNVKKIYMSDIRYENNAILRVFWWLQKFRQNHFPSSCFSYLETEVENSNIYLVTYPSRSSSNEIFVTTKKFKNSISYSKWNYFPVFSTLFHVKCCRGGGSLRGSTRKYVFLHLFYTKGVSALLMKKNWSFALCRIN